MRSLIYLEEALLENSQEKISGYFAEIDRQTSNAAMRKAGDQFGFKTCEVNGMVMANMAETAKVLGYSDPSGLVKLLERYQIMAYQIGWFGHDGRTRMRKTFGLSEKDGRAAFVTWDGVLVAGMYGQNAEARKIKLYLLKMETIGRVSLAADPKMELAAKNYELKRLTAQINLALKIDKMGDSLFKDSAILDLEQMTGRRFPRATQQKLFSKPE
jgi:hypothetical protein